MSVFIKSEYKISDKSFNHALPSADYCLYTCTKSKLKIKDTLKIFNIVFFPILTLAPMIWVYNYVESKLRTYQSYVNRHEDPKSILEFYVDLIQHYLSIGKYDYIIQYVMLFLFLFLTIRWLIKRKETSYTIDKEKQIVYCQRGRKIWFAPWNSMRVKLWRRAGPQGAMLEQLPALRLFRLKPNGSLERKFFPVGGFRGPKVPDECHDMSLGFAHWLKLYMAGNSDLLDEPIIAKSNWREYLFLFRGPKPEPAGLADKVCTMIKDLEASGVLATTLAAEPETVPAPTPEEVLIENMGKLKDTIPAHNPDDYAEMLINCTAQYETEQGVIEWDQQDSSITALEQSLKNFNDSGDSELWQSRVEQAKQRGVFTLLSENIAPFRNAHQRFDLVTIERDSEQYRRFLIAWAKAYQPIYTAK